MLERLASVGKFFRKVKGPIAYLYCIFLGVLAALAMPPYPFLPLFFAAVVLVLLLLDAQPRVWRAFGYGVCFGVGFYGFGLYWVVHSFYALGEFEPWVGPVMVTLMVLILSLFPGGAFLLTRLLWHKHWFQRAMAFAGLFGVFEFVSGFLLQFPWNPVSQIWWPSDIMMQGLALGGSAGLGLITLLAGGLMTPLFDGRVSKNHRLYTPATGLFILAAMGTYGWVRLNGAEVKFHNDLVVRLVQANIPQNEKWVKELYRRNLDKYISLSVVPEGPLGKPNLIIWPETAIPYDMEYVPTRSYVMSFFENQKVVTGASRQVLEPDPELTNSVYAIGGENEILARYDKARLVPFGEYIPGRFFFDIFGLDNVVPGSRDFDPGPGVRTLTIEGLPSFSPLVCYEIIFSGDVLDDQNRPDWILNVTNDAWFGDSAGPRQHFQMARARAIEDGVPVIRVAGTGISAVVDPYGRVLQKIDLGEEGYLDSGIPLKNPNLSVFSRFGRGLAGGLAALFFLVGAGSGRAERSRKGQKG